MALKVLYLTQVLVAAAVVRASSLSLLPQATTASTKALDREIPTTQQPVPYLRRDCSAPYFRIGRECLSVLYTFNVTWEGARGFCRALDGDLVVAASFQDLLLAYLDAYASFTKMFRCTFWIGARRADALSSFQWLDGSDLPPLASPAWDYQDDDTYNCVSLEVDHNNNFKFKNADCKDRNRMICQCLACEL
ncbi:C-type lectin domain family 18 member C-like [Penaeus japonicus]|uniref:C-type lectin domain family 18 member C-like n=1 Tax=Penaeus japonicus TaxID=27405 RepID=UPI001C716076|nr:C-type lectin domain family 18 member C-like [Penaeus japonicus]